MLTLLVFEIGLLLDWVVMATCHQKSPYNVILLIRVQKMKISQIVQPRISCIGICKSAMFALLIFELERLVDCAGEVTTTVYQGSLSISIFPLWQAQAKAD